MVRNWTISTLYEHLTTIISNNEKNERDRVDQIIDRIEETTRLQFESMEKIIAQTQEALDKRLCTMNEFRETINDQRESLERRMSDCLLKKEFDIQHEAVQRDIQSLRESRSELQGKASMVSIYITAAIAAISLAISVFSLLEQFMHALPAM